MIRIVKHGKPLFNKWFRVVPLPIIAIALSSCGYWPVADYFVPADFTKYDYRSAGSQDTTMIILENDSLKLSITANAFLPHKKRSENLHLFWATLNLKLTGSASETLSIDLDQSNVLLVSDTTTISASIRPTQVEEDNNRLILYRNPRSQQNSIHAEFRYTKNQKRVLKSHQLKLSLKRVRIHDRYVDINPVTFEIKLDDN